MASSVSNTVLITVGTPPSDFQLTAGNQVIGTGYIDLYAAGNYFDFGPIGSLNPVDATVSDYQVASLCFTDLGGEISFNLLLYGAPVDLEWSISFIDNESNVETFTSAESGMGSSNGTETVWTILTALGYVPMTNGDTYTIVSGGGASPVAAPVLSGFLNDIGSEILLTWTCATSGITAFTLYKNANNSGFALYQTLAGDVFQFIDTITDDPVDDIDSAAYYLVAQVDNAYSGPSNEVDNEIGGTL